MAEQRLQKVLAAAGVASRRASELLISAGRVLVNGEVAELGSKCDPATDVVTVDGERINVDPDRVYVMLNKPQGVLTTVDDPEGRPTVMDLINLPQRLYPVGRLDQDTEGLLLLTNDGELTNALTHPSYGVERTYVALVPGPVRKNVLADLRAGIELDDGLARPVRAQVLGTERSKALLEVVMTEGRKREVRRMLGALGLHVERLARVEYGGVQLGDLRQGKWRFLTHKEISRLHAATGGAAGTTTSGAGKSSPGKSGSGRSGAGRAGAGKSGSGRSGSGRSGAGRAGTGKSGSGKSSSGRSSTGTSGSGRSGGGEKNRRRPQKDAS